MNPDYRKAKKQFSRLGMAYFTFIAVSLTAKIAVEIFFAAVSADLYAEHATLTLVLSMGCMYLVGFPLFCRMLKRTAIPGASGERHSLSPASFAAFLLISLGVMEAGNLTGSLLMTLISAVLGRPIENQIVPMVTSGNLAVSILFSVLVAPVFEELMFRRMLIDRIRQYGDRTAILVSGILFGLIHGNFYQFFYACGLGMLFAYIYLRTGQVGYTVLLHMTVNFLGGIVGALLLRWSVSYSAAVLFLGSYTILLLFLSLSGLILLIRFRRQRVLLTGPEELPPYRRLSTAFFNPGMTLFFLVCALLFWLNMR